MTLLTYHNQRLKVQYCGSRVRATAKNEEKTTKGPEETYHGAGGTVAHGIRPGDTGAGTLIINEDVRQKLGLKVEKYRPATLADGTVQSYGQTEPVKIQWKERDMICQPLLLPNAGEILLGAIPLEEMDLVVDPKKQELTGRHGDEIVMRV